jgi:hypothetical protein
MLSVIHGTRDRQLRRLLAQAISAHKRGDRMGAKKLLDAAIEHIGNTPEPPMQQQQQIQPAQNKKK